MTRHAAVLGSPIAHSLSPTLHRAGFAEAGIVDWDYSAHEVDEAGLAPFVAGLDVMWRGLSLTMPLKLAAFAVADEVSDLAREARAINTLVRTDTGWAGDNTDVYGILAALRDAGVDAPVSATVIGAGATARSALIALRELDVGPVRVAVRDEAKGAALAESMTGLDIEVEPLRGWALRPTEVVISTVPGGAANEAAAGAVDALPSEPDLAGAVLLDVVYADWPTPLARAASARGATVVPGLEVLVHQAARQFELFTGVAAPVGEMQAAGRSALDRDRHTSDA